MSPFTLPELSSYPISKRGPEFYLDNTVQLRELLTEKAGVTFVSNPTQISLEINTSPVMSTCNITENRAVLTSSDDLEQLLLARQNLPMHCMFIISQNGSWSRLKLTKEMFLKISIFFNILPSFIEIVTSFGMKIRDDDEYYTACYRRYQWDRGRPPKYYELCYNVRFAELHGRTKPASPWSFRQYAVYQRYDYESQASTWIVIRHKESFKDLLRNPGSQGVETCPWTPFYLHYLLLRSSTSSWRWFLNHLTSSLDRRRLKVVCQLDRKRTYGHDDIEFAQCQALELLQTQAKHAVILLESSISVAENLRSQFSDILQVESPLPRDASEGRPDLENEFTQLSQQLSMHKRKAQDLVTDSKSVSLLTQRVVDHRNTATSHASSVEVRQHSATAALESRAMVAIGESSRRDARVMKIVSIIALGYLPIGLVASFFSTDLVQLASLVTNAKKGLGIFLLFVALLTVTTVTTAYVWIRRDRQQRFDAHRAIP